MPTCLRIVRTTTLAAAVTAAFSFSLPAAAARTDARAANPKATTAPSSLIAANPDRMICVRAQITGSRLFRRICRTERQWEDDGGVPTER